MTDEDDRYCNGSPILEACASDEIHSVVSHNPNGSVASLKIRKKNAISAAGYLDLLGDESEQLSNKPDLTPNVVSLHPPNLPLPHHVYRFIALNGSSGRLKFPEALLGVDPTFDRAMVLLEDVIQVWTGR